MISWIELGLITEQYHGSIKHVPETLNLRQGMLEAREQRRCNVPSFFVFWPLVNKCSKDNSVHYQNKYFLLISFVTFSTQCH